MGPKVRIKDIKEIEEHGVMRKNSHITSELGKKKMIVVKHDQESFRTLT